MSDDMSVYTEVFMSESAEYIEAITNGLLALERDPDDLEPVETIFRGAHSLKGMAGAMGYPRTQELAHKLESLMDTVRHRTQVADRTLIDLSLRSIDVMRSLIDDEMAGGAAVDASPMIRALAERTAVPVAPSHSASSTPAPTGDPSDGALISVRVTLDAEVALKGVRAYMVVKRLGYMGVVLGTTPETRDLEDERFGLEFDVIMRTRSAAEAISEAVLGVSDTAGAAVTVLAEADDGSALPEAVGPTGGRRPSKGAAETQTVRLSVHHLDRLVNLVGELVIVRSRLGGVARDHDDPALLEAIDRLESVSSELQHEVLKTRMVPVGNIFTRFSRMVRDLSRDLGKDVAFEMAGVDIELDRIVLDEVGDPIVHVLRNSIDHGIEPPDERRAVGKAPRGALRLAAERERDQVRITVIDDGRGMDPEHIWAKAVAAGIVDGAERERYRDGDILMLVCTPGFSTAETATRVSGRGVGMDVVRGKIEHLGGSVTIESIPGQGTGVTLVLPLTLAIVPALLVGAGGHAYAIPLSMVDEVLAESDVTVGTIENEEVVRGRDGSVTRLHDLARICATGEGAPDGRDAGGAQGHIIRVHTRSGVHAVRVPTLLGRREIVVKPLSPLFRGVRGFSGATVLGDGRVALIIDPRTLFSKEA